MWFLRYISTVVSHYDTPILCYLSALSLINSIQKIQIGIIRRGLSSSWCGWTITHWSLHPHPYQPHLSFIAVTHLSLFSQVLSPLSLNSSRRPYLLSHHRRAWMPWGSTPLGLSLRSSQSSIPWNRQTLSLPCLPCPLHLSSSSLPLSLVRIPVRASLP